MPDSSESCSVCHREFGLGVGLGHCHLCRRPVCGSCVVRMSGNVFCGRGCAHAFFYGGQEDTEEPGEGGGEEE